MSKQSIESMVSGLAAMRDRLSEHSFAIAHVTKLSTAAEALHRITQSTGADSKERHAQRISSGAQRYLESIARTRDDIQQRELAGLQSLHEQFAQKVNLTTDGFRYAGHVVDAFARADQGQKVAMLNEILESGDGQSLATLMQAPRFASGIDPQQLAHYRDLVEQKHAPEVWERRQTFQEDLAAAGHALSEAQRIAEAALQITDVDSALQQAEETRQAEAQLEAATS